MLICGPLCADQELPFWPLSATNTSDERLLKVYVEFLEPRRGWLRALVNDAAGLTMTRRFRRIFLAISTWLESVPVMDGDAIIEAMTAGVALRGCARSSGLPATQHGD